MINTGAKASNKSLSRTLGKMEMSPSQQALLDLILEISPAYRSLLVAGRKLGTRSARGGYWGVMHILSETGPQTVPQLARRRNVSRQNIQPLVNFLLEKKYVELIDNPDHKRSMLVSLTPAGATSYRSRSDKLRKWVKEIAHDFRLTDLQTSLSILRSLSKLMQSTSGN